MEAATPAPAAIVIGASRNRHASKAYTGTPAAEMMSHPTVGKSSASCRPGISVSPWAGMNRKTICPTVTGTHKAPMVSSPLAASGARSRSRTMPPIQKNSAPAAVNTACRPAHSPMLSAVSQENPVSATADTSSSSAPRYSIACSRLTDSSEAISPPPAAVRG